MENQNKTTNACDCDCTVCRVGHHRMLRVIIIIFGLLIAFCLGVKYGEIKAFMRGGYDGWGRQDRIYMKGSYGGPMMYGDVPAPSPAGQTLPAGQGLVPAPNQ